MVALHFFPGVEILPFSCYPMFKSLNDLFDPAARKWLWLSDKPHTTGTLKNYCFPFCRRQCVQADELDRLPFKYLLLGHNGPSEEALYANFVVPDELRDLLWKIRLEGSCGAGVFRTKPEAAKRLLGLLFDAQAAFDRAEWCKKPSYQPPAPVPSPSSVLSPLERTNGLCPTNDTLGETDSTWSARSSRSSGEQQSGTDSGKLSVFDDIAKSFSGSCAGEGPLRVLCTNARVLEEVLARHGSGRVCMTLLQGEPADVEAAARLKESGHAVALTTHSEVAAELLSEGSRGPFDAVLVERERLCELPPEVLSRGARIVVV
mmetsp:Transcript_50743/g.157137  ORF Transcript_50743/g.157137 Transcript_50743/m.157137 type:complete len:318 (+) Transcript_50743:901-1854(+)